jgi:hypothetical protein
MWGCAMLLQELAHGKMHPKSTSRDRNNGFVVMRRGR